MYYEVKLKKKKYLFYCQVCCLVSEACEEQQELVTSLKQDKSLAFEESLSSEPAQQYLQSLPELRVDRSISDYASFEQSSRSSSPKQKFNQSTSDPGSSEQYLNSPEHNFNSFTSDYALIEQSSNLSVHKIEQSISNCPFIEQYPQQLSPVQNLSSTSDHTAIEQLLVPLSDESKKLVNSSPQQSAETSFEQF